MMNAYDKTYLEDAMHNLGVMADFSVNVAGVPETELWQRFLASGIAERFAKGNPDIVAGCSGIELAMMVMNRTGRTVSPGDGIVSISSPQYWAGWILAYYQWLRASSFKRLSLAGLNLSGTVSLFNPLHEADVSKFIELADKMTGQVPSTEWLKRVRMLNGLTQKELAAKSGVSLRLIRAYEQGTIATDNAEFGTVEKLARALHIQKQ